MDKVILKDSARKRLQDFEKVRAELALGHQGQEIMGLSTEEMALCYSKALQLFKEKSYIEATDAFLFLAFMNHEIPDYWLGLGMATQMCHGYEAAIDAYELAAVYDLDNPVPYFYLAKCLFAIHDRSSAQDALDMAIELAKGRDEYTELLEQAIHAKEVLFHAVG
jgi:type III secretion system low calcium response chaperone LcrH/SycD